FCLSETSLIYLYDVFVETVGVYHWLSSLRHVIRLARKRGLVANRGVATERNYRQRDQRQQGPFEPTDSFEDPKAHSVKRTPIPKGRPTLWLCRRLPYPNCRLR